MERGTEKNGSNRRQSVGDAKANGRHGHVIRIVAESDQERALAAFGTLPAAVHSIAEDEFLVLAQHIRALRKAGIPFEDITESPVKHGKTTAG